VQCDSVILRDGNCPRRKAGASNHDGLVGTDLLFDLLKQQDVRLINFVCCPPFGVGNMEVRGELVTSLPVEVDLMPVFRTTRRPTSARSSAAAPRW